MSDVELRKRIPLPRNLDPDDYRPPHVRAAEREVSDSPAMNEIDSVATVCMIRARLGALPAPSAASPPAYVEPAPTYVVVSERHRHHNSHGAESSPKARVVTRAMKPMPAVMPAPDAGEADLRKCLTKEYLPDRSVVFKDNCTKESASTSRSAPVMDDFSAPPKVSQSIRLEPLMANDDVPQQMDGP